MKEVDQLHPDRFDGDAPVVKKQTDDVVDQWFRDHFHGPHHARALADPHEYVRAAAEDLKRRLSEQE